MLEVPGRTSGAHEAAARMQQCARTARAATARWEGTTAPSWSGEAAAGFEQARVLLSRLTRDLVEVSAGLSEAVQAYAQEMAVVLPMWRTAVADWHRARDQELDAVDPVAAGQRTFQVEGEVARWHGRAETAGQDLLAAAQWVLSALQPYSDLERQVDDGLRTFVQVGLVEPVQTVGFLALGWTVDQPGWQQQVRSIPAAVEQAARHPWDTFRAGAASAAGLEHFRAGNWGAGAGTIAGGLIGGRGFGKGLRGQPVDAETRARFPGAIFASHLSPPRTQTLDEMLTDGIDLTRHEHTQLGHTLRRHVTVTDDYLADRLDHGTILDNGRRGNIPPSASAWTDLDTAEANITQALQRHEGELRALMLNSGRPNGQLHLTLGTADGSSVGRSMWDEGGQRHLQDTSTFTVVLEHTAEGHLVVLTAYPERPTS